MFSAHFWQISPYQRFSVIVESSPTVFQLRSAMHLADAVFFSYGILDLKITIGYTMLESIKEYTSSALGTAIQRVKNPAFGAIALSWIAFNWKQLLYLFMSNTSVLDKIEYIVSTSTWRNVIGYPVVSAIFICGFIPWANYLIATWQIKPLDHTDSIDNQRKAKIIRRATRLQRLQAKHDVTYDKVKTGAEKDIQTMKEQITASQDRMGELTAALDEKEDQLNRYSASLLESRKNADIANEKLNQLINDYRILEEKHNSLKSFYDAENRRVNMAERGPSGEITKPGLNPGFALRGLELNDIEEQLTSGIKSALDGTQKNRF